MLLVIWAVLFHLFSAAYFHLLSRNRLAEGKEHLRFADRVQLLRARFLFPNFSLPNDFWPGLLPLGFSLLPTAKKPQLLAHAAQDGKNYPRKR